MTDHTQANTAQPDKAPFSDGSGARGLTSTQREALEWLKAKRDALPMDRWSYGFNPPNGRRSMVAAMRTALARRGFVELQRISDRHIRYEITEAGRAALSPRSARHG